MGTAVVPRCPLSHASQRPLKKLVQGEADEKGNGVQPTNASMYLVQNPRYPEGSFQKSMFASRVCGNVKRYYTFPCKYDLILPAYEFLMFSSYRQCKSQFSTLVICPLLSVQPCFWDGLFPPHSPSLAELSASCRVVVFSPSLALTVVKIMLKYFCF